VKEQYSYVSDYGATVVEISDAGLGSLADLNEHMAKLQSKPPYKVSVQKHVLNEINGDLKAKRVEQTKKDIDHLVNCGFSTVLAAIAKNLSPFLKSLDPEKDGAVVMYFNSLEEAADEIMDYMVRWEPAENAKTHLT